ncbi:MAG: hypothetical protein JRJ38_16565 [Deltaproteobacteria bacterium]|nr:hypothetical protein [Deltaproteobacteria bacterium]
MFLDAEAVARHFALRAGCRFIGCKPVGIAVFSMNLRVLVLEPRTVPPIEEFILRFLLEGIDSLRVLSDLLGLSPDLVTNRLIDLRRNEFLDVEQSNGSELDTRFILTERGQEVARSLRQNVMHEITLPNVVFHGLLRVPVQLGDYSRQQYLKPKEANNSGLTLIRAIPNRYPHPEELNVDMLNTVFKAGRRRDGAERDIVAVKSVLKMVYTLYEPAFMLEYETDDHRRERQVAFVVEGQIKEEYESTFARVRGPELLADVMTPAPEPIRRRIERLAEDEQIVERLGKLDDVEELASRVALARQEVEDARRALEEEDRSDTRSVLRKKIEQLEQEKENLEQERNSRAVKFLWTPEIREKFWEAIRTARDRLLILSGFISSYVVNRELEEGLRDALKRGVKIWIGYGFGRDNRRGQEQRVQTKWKEAEKAFEQLNREFPDLFTYKDIGRSHEKRLICDDRFTFGGSFNLLSFSGESRGGQKIRHEGADLIEDKEFCDQLYSKYVRMFFQ